MTKTGRKVYYLKQLEVLLEKQFFHWVTASAVNRLIGAGWLKAVEEELLGATRVKFIHHRSARYTSRQIKAMLSVIREYSRPEVARAAGVQAELLFMVAFAMRSFSLNSSRKLQAMREQAR